MTVRRRPASPRIAHRRVHGAAVRALREAMLYRHGYFAVECDISPGFLTHIEQGNKQPSDRVAAAIAAKLGVPLDVIQYEVPACPVCAQQDAA